MVLIACARFLGGVMHGLRSESSVWKVTPTAQERVKSKTRPVGRYPSSRHYAVFCAIRHGEKTVVGGGDLLRFPSK